MKRVGQKSQEGTYEHVTEAPPHFMCVVDMTHLKERVALFDILCGVKQEVAISIYVEESRMGNTIMGSPHFRTTIDIRISSYQF